MPTRHALVSTIALTTVLVAFLALTFPSIGVGPYGPVGHIGCVGSAVMVSRFWTPQLLVNSPYGGKATGVVSFPGEDWSTSASDGSAGGMFELDNWTLNRLTTTWVAGPGQNVPCTSAYGATYSPGGDVTTMGLMPENSTSDAAELTHFSYPSFLPYGPQIRYPSVIFDNSFSAPTETTYPACGEGAVANLPLSAASSQINVVVEFPYGPAVIVVDAVVAASETFTYSLSPDATGTWAIDEVTGPGFAFAWTPC